MHDLSPTLPTPTEDELREVAVKRVKVKRDFRTHLFVYIVVNIGLWTMWIIDGVQDSWEFPWPAVVMVFWGAFLANHWHDAYRRDPLHEDLVQKEIDQLRAAARVRPLRNDDPDDT